MSRAHRLLRRPEFDACFANGRRYYSKRFILYAWPRTEGPTEWRAGWAVSRKVGSAVKRNRIRRCLREMFRLHQDEVPPQVDFIVIPKRALNPRDASLRLVSDELLPLIRTVQENLAMAGGRDA